MDQAHRASSGSGGTEGCPDVPLKHERSRGVCAPSIPAIDTAEPETSQHRGSVASPNARTRYARTSDANQWLYAQREGVVPAILDSVEDGRDRVVLAWPAPPDNGFVALAIALREARTSGRLRQATFGLWPWRSGATHAARSILVHPKDVATAAARAAVEIRRGATWANPRLAHEAQSLVELRLNDLVGTERTCGSGPHTDTAKPKKDAVVVRSPTLFETTSTFAPSADPLALAYERDVGQVLKRVRSYTHLGDKHSTMDSFIEAVGDPAVAPFVIMGLAPSHEHDLRRWLAHSRFVEHGLDAVLVDLTHTARTVLAPDWERQVSSLLCVLDSAVIPRPPVIALCEDIFAMRRVEVVLGSYARNASPMRMRSERRGALLLDAGMLEVPGPPRIPPDLPPIEFETDFKDATLVPLRQRLVGLARRLGDVGCPDEASHVVAALRFVRSCACLPVGCGEAQQIASVLFDGGGSEAADEAARAAFFASSALQPLAKVGETLPEFALEVRELLKDVRSRVDAWKDATPISLKLKQLLLDEKWNSRDVLIALPDTRTADVFLVSDLGMVCKCEITDTRRLAARVLARPWRRIILLSPGPQAVRTILTMQAQPERVLLLGDTAGIALLEAEIAPLMSLSAFECFAKRAIALSQALSVGGAGETIDLVEAEFRYRVPVTNETIDLTRASDRYHGEVIRLRLEGGECVLYRATSDVLTFTPDEVRPFKRSVARDVQVGDSILVLRRSLRDRLSEALSRSRKTAVQLQQYHSAVSQFRDRLAGDTLAAKARVVLAAMQRLDPSIGQHEAPNIKRWLSVKPSDEPCPPCAARDRHRFSVFMKAAEIAEPLARGFWDFAVCPSRAYNAQEGHLFNRRTVQFVLDPEGVAASAGCLEFDGLWQAVTDAVEIVVLKETLHV